MGSFCDQHNYDYEKVITEKTVQETRKTVSGGPFIPPGPGSFIPPDPGHPEKSRATSRRRQIQILIIISVFSSGISLFVTISSFIILKVSDSQTYMDSQLCLPCSILRYQPTDTVHRQTTDTVHRQVRDGQSLCCFSNITKTEAQSMVELVNMRQNGGSTKNSAHVYYSEDSQGSLEQNEQPNKLKGWTKTGEKVHIGDGIHCDDKTGDFTVTVSGNYMIYSHMAFQLPAHELHRLKGQDHNLTFLFDHRLSIIHTEVDTPDTVIMKESAEVVCTFRASYGGKLYPCHVSNLIGMIPLVEGEKMSVEVSPLKYLLGELQSSYFGLLLMD